MNIALFNLDIGGFIIPMIGLSVMIVILIITIPRARRNNAKLTNNAKNKLQQTGGDTNADGEEIFETSTLVEDVMTTQEKNAYHYFIDEPDDNEKKGGCLHKGGGESGFSDSDYDDIVTAKLNDFGSKARALNKIGMDETQVNEIEPIRFYGFEKYSRRLSNNFFSKIGKDGRRRTSVCSITWLFFSNDQILVYTGRFDLLTSAKREMTTEYYYKDITNFYTFVETDQRIELKPHTSGCIKKKTSVDTERKLTDHDTFGLTVPGDKFYCSVSGVANAKQIIDGLKQKLREKKIF